MMIFDFDMQPAIFNQLATKLLMESKMKFIVNDSDGVFVSSHRKWERALDRAVTMANRRNGRNYHVMAVTPATEWLFSISKPGKMAGVNTEFTGRSLDVRYEIGSRNHRVHSELHARKMNKSTATA